MTTFRFETDMAAAAAVVTRSLSPYGWRLDQYIAPSLLTLCPENGARLQMIGSGRGDRTSVMMVYDAADNSPFAELSFLWASDVDETREYRRNDRKKSLVLVHIT